jgi:hypothetical protein
MSQKKLALEELHVRSFVTYSGDESVGLNGGMERQGSGESTCIVGSCPDSVCDSTIPVSIAGC